MIKNVFLYEKNVGIVKTEYFTFAEPPNEMVLESGERLGPITLAYETYGKLNKERSNAILVLHALSGDAHAAGFHEGDSKPGWWDGMIGPGKAIDTEKYFVISSNVIGGCKGSTGPSSINPKTKRPYGLDFPIITIGDMVNAQIHLIEKFGIKKILSVIGGSMGGMQVLQWMHSYPDRINSAIPIATTLRHNPQQIAFNEIGRKAIMADPNWDNGNYYGHSPPLKGLAIARMIGHVTYLSAFAMNEKFGRRIKENKEYQKFSPEFEVEHYLRYKGDNFVKRFDANSYLYITKAMDYFDLLNNNKTIDEIFKNLKAKILVISFKSDWLYPPEQSLEIVKACQLAGVDFSYHEINSNYGHDSFLVDIKEQAEIIKNFLKDVADMNGVET